MYFVKYKKLYNYWISLAFGCLFLVSTMGIIMRASIFFGLPLSFSNILHSHSHTALLGWSFIIAVSGIISYFKLHILDFRYEILISSVSIIGMFLAFLYQSYGAISITFSSLFVINSYIFFYRIFRKIKISSFKSYLFKWAMIWFFISTIGIWCIPPVTILYGKNNGLYDLAIHFFLHFQINGWLSYVGMAFLFDDKLDIPMKKKYLLALNSSLVLSFFINVYWINPNFIFYLLNTIGVITGLICYYFILKYLFQKNKLVDKNQEKLYYFILLTLFFKPIIQLSLLDSIFSISLVSNRFLIIAFLHYVLLGFITFSFIFNFFQYRFISNIKLYSISIIFLIIGFIATEIILMLQGFGIFSIYFPSMLFLFSFIAWVGIGLLSFQVNKKILK